MGQWPPRDMASSAWRRLWHATRPIPAHAPDASEVGEYAALLHRDGPALAGRTFPRVAAHLASGCRACEADLQEVLRMLSEPGV